MRWIPWVIAWFATGSERFSFAAPTALGGRRDADGEFSVKEDEDEDEDEEDVEDDFRAQGSRFSRMI